MSLKSKLKALKYYTTKYYNELIDKYLTFIVFQKSFLNIKLSNKNVIIGLAYTSIGGLANHINSIEMYSKFRPLRIPSPKLIKLINSFNKQEFFRSSIIKNTKRFPFKIFHSHVDPWFVNISAQAQLSGSKWIHTYHTLYFEQDWDKPIEPWQIETNNTLINVARNADVKISISYWLKNYLLENYAIESIYIPNGVDIDKCDKADANRFLAKYKFKDFILFASGIYDIKNPKEFIRLAAAIPEKQFIMIGRELSVLALQDKFKITIPPNLCVLGQMSHEELLDAIAACKVFVVTSRSEGLPTVLMEAMALQRSVVGCDTFGTKEVIGSEEFGYIYNHLSFDDLVKKTRQAWDDTSKGIQARERVLSNYDWKKVISQIDNIYQELIY